MPSYEEKIDELKIQVAAGFARNDALGEGINRRLDVLNSKVAQHEAILNNMQIKEAVQKNEVDGLKARNEYRDTKADKLKFLTTDKLLGMVVGLIGMGIVSVITFYMTYK